MVYSRILSSRNGSCARGGHGRMTVRFPGGIRLASTVSARLTPESWREPNVGMDPTLRIDRRDC